MARKRYRLALLALKISTAINRMEEVEKGCEWMLFDDHQKVFKTWIPKCLGRDILGSPGNYCPYCGRKVKVREPKS